MRISKISTGRKLDQKTFGELEEGDKLYWASSLDNSMEDVTFTIKSGVGKCNIDDYGYTDLNPDKQAPLKCNISLKIEDKYGTYCCNVPSNVKYLVSDDVVVTTTEESLFQLIKNYKLASHLI